jgi:ribosomal protein L37AE/L43A
MTRFKFASKLSEMTYRRPLDSKIKKIVLERDRYRCVECEKTSDLQVHHIIPVSKGGKDIPENLKTFCKRCHKKYHRRLGIKINSIRTFLCIRVPTSYIHKVKPMKGKQILVTCSLIDNDL